MEDLMKKYRKYNEIPELAADEQIVEYIERAKELHDKIKNGIHKYAQLVESNKDKANKKFDEINNLIAAYYSYLIPLGYYYVSDDIPYYMQTDVLEVLKSKEIVNEMFNELASANIDIHNIYENKTTEELIEYVENAKKAKDGFYEKYNIYINKSISVEERIKLYNELTNLKNTYFTYMDPIIYFYENGKVNNQISKEIEELTSSIMDIEEKTEVAQTAYNDLVEIIGNPTINIKENESMFL